MRGKQLSDTGREREIFKYYQPPSPPTIRDNGQAPSPSSSKDTALTSFAQLASLRLKAKRALITLLGREVYIIAEATQTLSLQSEDVYGTTDKLWKGEAVLSKCQTPCAVAFDAFTDCSTSAADRLIVDDLSQDGRFKDVECVTGFPFTKFYAAVPIITPSGHVIGILSIMDDKPRSAPSEAEQVFLTDISTTIMDHLESRRIRQQHHRAERMIRGLGLFVEGKSSIKDWWLNTHHDINEAYEKHHNGKTVSQRADEEFGVQELPDTPNMDKILGSGSNRSRGDVVGSRSEFTPAVSSANRPRYPPAQSDTSVEASTAPSEGPDTTFTKPPDATETIFSQGTSQSGRGPSPPADEDSGAQLQEATLSNEIRDAFARASNLIREAITADGALFLDASIGTFGGSSTTAEIGFRGPGARDQQRTTPTSTSSSDEPRHQESASTPSPAKTCRILGYSTQTRSSLKLHESSALHASVTEAFLRKLLRRYPHGKVFSFDEEGCVSGSEEELRGATLRTEVGAESSRVTSRPPKKKKMSRQAEAKEVLQILPGARSVAFFPLWDSHKERWFSGSIVWTNNATRSFSPDEDLTYLASFGNSIMAEVARLDALSKSQLKDSFVASISHELRSPLHGVLASVELIQDTSLDSFQQEMVSLIASCGRTLLDTINHILDFTKHRTTSGYKTRDSKHRGNSTGQSLRASVLAKAKNRADILVLTEEVMEGLCSGNEFGRSQADSSGTQSPIPSPAAAPPPAIIVTVGQRADWCFDIDPGAWRRLVMNIFGNALKYTEAGFIRVSLGIQTEDEARVSPADMVTLRISDSGKGISKEFLHNHLYTPFVQENSMAGGSGLGLSIVKNIVNELGGSVSFESEQEIGTEVVIALPLISAKPSAPLVGQLDEILRVRKQVHGMEVRLVGFDVFPNLGDEPTGLLSMDARRSFYLKDSLTALFKDWFGMNVTVSSDFAPSKARLSIIMDSTFAELAEDSLRNAGPGGLESKKSALWVLSTRAIKMPSLDIHANFDVHCVQQPIGPHKLARMLASSLASDRPRPTVTTTLTERPAPGVVEERSAEGVVSPTSKALRFSVPYGGSLKDSVTRSDIVDSPASLLSPQSTTSSGRGLSTPLSRGPGSSGSSLSCRVLLVEDNAVNLKLLVKYMQKLKIDYATAENGLVAVEQYENGGPFQLVFMDITMPIMDGLEASRRIRAYEQGAQRNRTAIVALTGASSESARHDAFTAGIDQFLTKPVSLTVLKEYVDQYGVKNVDT